MPPLLNLYLACATRATKQFIRGWLIMPGVVGAFLIYSIAQPIFRPLGIAGGFALGLLTVLLLSCYYRWITLASRSERITPHDLVTFDYPLFSSVLNVGFMLWLFDIGLGFFAANFSNPMVGPAISLVLVLALNALPEVIYLQRSTGFPALQEALIFTRDNWIEWFLPFLLAICPILVIHLEAGALAVLFALSAGDPLLPPYVLLHVPVLIVGWSYYLALALGLLFVNWFMLFRANLFLELEAGGLRRRAFRAKIGDGWR